MEFTSEEIGKLLSLLGSENRANAQVAVAILEGRNSYRRFVTDLYIKALTETDGRKKQFFIRCINNISPKGFTFQLQNIRGYLEMLRLHEDSMARQIYRVAKNLKLDGQLLLKYVLERRTGWLQELWCGENSHRRRDVLRFQFREISRLWVMHLHELNLRKLPDELEDFPNVQVLDLRNNRFQKVPEGLEAMEQLRIIDLRGNHIKKLPPDLSVYAQLDLLDLRNNPIEINRNNLDLFREHIFLKADLGEYAFAMLEGSPQEQQGILPCFLEFREGQLALNLANMGLNSLPEAVFSFKDIEVLDLRNNRLTSLPRRLADLPRLRTIDVVHNFGIKIHPRIQKDHFIKVVGPGSSQWRKPKTDYWDFPEALTATRAAGFRQLLKQKGNTATENETLYQPRFYFEINDDIM